LTIGSSFTFFGYGLGGTSTHLAEIVPPEGARAIAKVSWASMPNLKTLIGRIIAETGMLGLILFMYIFAISFREYNDITNAIKQESEMVAIKVSFISLMTTLFALSISYGSFATPYLWFWLAFIDSQLIKIHMSGSD
jgi:hypothetical protein